MAHKFEHLKIQLEAIKSATNNFADESCIGKGGFGRVYKGKIGGSDGHTMVALKRLDPRFGQGVAEFWKEVMLLSQYKHNNIVSLLGFCDEGGEKILVYEYVPNKSLDRYISSDNLRWIQRLKICIDAAHGLAYLHNAYETQQRVLHRDIKSANILLDENWNAKISDFGLSKLGPANQEYTFLYSHPVGTLGYVDPLYAETGYLTKESDVYSFGVVLFEVLCGRLCIGYKNVKHLSFAELARQSFEQNIINEIVYVNMKDEIDPKSLQAFAKIAYQCLKRDPDQRPLMSHVVGALETALCYQELKRYQVSNAYLPPEPSMVLESDRGKGVLNLKSGLSVVGFDIGNEKCVIAAVRNREIDVLLNDESSCETPAVVAFCEKQRFFGTEGASSAWSYPKSTISQVKRLIGRAYRNPDVQKDIKLLPFKTSEAPNGGVLIHLQYLNEQQTFTPVQILAMLFAHLKQIAEKNLEIHVTECVIGIPSYFTDLQRREYLDAAHLAGLTPLRLMHDCTAIALGYGFYKNDFSDTGPTNVVFVDIGHCDTQVTVAAFEQGQLKILSHSFDNHLGGRDFDEVLFRYFAEKFKEQYNIDVYMNTRACVRLRTACEKLKKVLSANAEAPLNIECLMDEKDVKGFIKREEFENLCLDLLEKVTAPCVKAVKDAGIGVDQIYAIELVGSGSRIPAIMRKLAFLFGKEPRRTLNASECVARGCALHCAMLSPSFRVREYQVQDSFPFAIGLQSDEGEDIKLPNGTLFPKGHPFPSVKIISLRRSNTFHLGVIYINEDDLPLGVSPKIGHFTIGPFSSSEKTKVKVRVNLNIHGIVMIDSASFIHEGHSSNNAHSHSERTVVDNDMSNGGHAESSPSTTHSARRQKIPVTENIYGGTTIDELRHAQETEGVLAEQDIDVERTKEKKNTLESFVYDTRNKLLSSYRSFATDEERDGISRNLQETEDWLYEDGDDESEQAYTGRLQDLKKLVDPVESRYKEEDARAQATKTLSSCINKYRVAANKLPATEREAVYSECSKAEQWLHENSQLQASMPKNADPILLSTEINQKADILERMLKHITRNKYSASNYDDAYDSNQRDKPDDMYVD